MIKIVCMGDNVVDINWIDGMVNPGGNCINGAVYCSQMGHFAAYVGVLADDVYARIVTDSLKQNQVDYRKSVFKHGETGRCTCKLVDGERILRNENNGGLVKSEPLIITDELIAYLKEFDLVHTSCYSYIDNQLEKVKAAGIPLLYDFSSAWNEEKVAQIGPLVDYILFSGKGDSLRENCHMMKKAVDQYGCKLTVMTMGTKGAWVYDGRRIYKKVPYNVDAGALDTTGCGDAWISGFITAYFEGKKRIERMTEIFDPSFITDNNRQDAMSNLISWSMSMGNLKARHTCRIKGAYGCGVSIDLK